MLAVRTSRLGIGRALTAQYLSRPKHTIVGSVRDANAPKNQDLYNLPKGPGSKLILVSIENKSPADAKAAVAQIQAAGIDHLDVVISSAGISHDPVTRDAVDTKDLVEAFEVNTSSTVSLFQAVLPLLNKAKQPKWVSVSSLAGSIGNTMAFNNYVGPYGMSKAAQNWFTATLHHAFPTLTVLAVHPGFVSSDLGNAIATNGGLPPPPTTPGQSAEKLIEFVDAADRTKGGRFFDSEKGEEIAW